MQLHALDENHRTLSNHLATAKVAHCEIIALPFAWRTAEDIPKAESLISGSGNNATPIRALIHVKYPSSMTLELLNLRHGRILPQAQLILTETMT